MTVYFRAADKGQIGCGGCARSEHFGGRYRAQGHLGSPGPFLLPRKTGLPGRTDDTIEEKVRSGCSVLRVLPSLFIVRLFACSNI